MTRAARLVDIEHLEMVYRSGDADVRALAGVQMQMDPGEFVAIMGPSGSGKSTLLNVLGTLDRPTAGRYLLNGTDVLALGEPELTHFRARAIGFVFQSFNLLAHRSVVDNVALPLLYANVPAAKRAADAADMLQRVGLGSLGARMPTQLSGGQQQRVAIARALCSRPLLVLADEPTGNLDSQTSAAVIQLLRDINREQGMAIVLVTHDPHVAEAADRLIEIADGRIVRDGPRR